MPYIQQLKVMRRKHGRQIAFGAILTLAAALPAYAHDRNIKSRVAPVYPEIARRMRVEGSVKVEATVDADGNVVGVKATDGNMVLSSAAEQAVKRWKFETGDATEKVTVSVNFTLEQ